MKTARRTIYLVFAVLLMVINLGCQKPSESLTETQTEIPESTTVVLSVPYIHEADVTYIQPFGVPLDFGDEIRPHAAVDFGCPDQTEFKASASGVLGNIWLNYPHSYQFNIVIDDRTIVHYCMEPGRIELLDDDDKLAAIYFSPGEPIEKDQKVCKMVGGDGHLDWGLIVDNERVCPACCLSDAAYDSVNALFKSLPGQYEGYDNLCPDNVYHTNPRP